ncbi:hypothetical protein CIJ86_16735 [Escherichia coli]|jgi:hypothetical protein|nr:hypothetical protein [Escherichia coli]OZY11525.1 hypothetical protein CIJ87_24780 [Escherichia coli]OZY18446.1 hypothetical protein CIJ86_16735 [Escherichia coli]PHL27800.1 hypothetical protein BMR39_27785 [Escherichia coli]
MLMASTRSYYVSMKFAFLNMSSGYVYRIDTFQPYVDKALFFKHVAGICLWHRHFLAMCR